MPSNLSFLDNNFPSFTSETTTEQKLDNIQNYLYMTVESLRYALSHLNAGNMEQGFVDSIIESGGSYAEIKQIVDEHSASISLLAATQTEQGTAIASIEETVTEQGAEIAIVVENGAVKAGVVVDAINNDSSVTISANRVNLTGYLTISAGDLRYDEIGAAGDAVDTLETSMAAGNTTIHGGCITANTIAINNIKCLDQTLNIYHTKTVEGEPITVQAGNLGYATGMSGGTETEGMAMKYDSTHYVICTSAGVRLQSGENSIWVTNSGTSIGQAVFG